jgi:heme/copper-type cytochrome/quinol oxidase subunit 2
MNTDGTEHMDAVDLLLKIAIFVCFVVFAIGLWFIRRERDRRKAGEDQNVSPKTRT